MNESNKFKKENEVRVLQDFLTSMYDFRYNTVLDRDEIKLKEESEYRTLNEQTLAEIEMEVMYAGFGRKKGIIHTMIKSRKLATKYNPFVDYFVSLRGKWKQGDKDWINELCAHLVFRFYKEPEQVQFANLMFKKHLVRTVACALRYIPFNKQCFVLQGGQSAGKSYFFRWLCPTPLTSEYYKENLQFDHKDATIALAENIMINLDELDGFDKHDASKIKTLISQDDFKVRRNYGVRDEKLTRYASFFGSINDVEFLNDLTGNVRWLVFELKEILHDNGGTGGYAHRIDKELVWAQALALAEDESFKCQLSKEEEQAVSKINSKFLKPMLEVELIERYFKPCESGEKDELFLTATDVLQVLTKLDSSGLRMTIDRVGKALKFLGFEKHSRRVNGGNPKYAYSVLTTSEEVISLLPSSAYYVTTNS